MSENSELPSVTDAFVKRIKTNEGDAQYLITNNIPDRIIFSTRDNNGHNYGVYEGLGKGKHVDKVYQKLISDGKITPDENGHVKIKDKDNNEIIIYTQNQKGSGMELVVGHGHMLTGENLAAYINDEDITVNNQPIKARKHFKNLDKDGAKKLLEKDIEKHQRELNAHLESLGIDKDQMTKSQREALDEAMFQMGRTTFSEFEKFWTKVKQAVDATTKTTKKQKWAEAGLELLYGNNHQEPSGIWKQTPDRVRQYMEQLGVSKGRIDAAKDWKEGENWNSGSSFGGDIYVSDTTTNNQLYISTPVDQTGPTSTVPETTEPSIQEAVATTETLEEIPEPKPQLSSYWGVQGYTPPKKSLKESISDYADKATNKAEIEELTEIHTAEEGDSLWKIAQKHKTNVRTLIDLNSEITEDNQGTINIGQKIKVPTSSFHKKRKELIDSYKEIIKNYEEKDAAKKKAAKEKAIKKLKFDPSQESIVDYVNRSEELKPLEISFAKKQARKNLETDIYSDPATPPEEDFFPSSVSPSAFDDFDEEAFTEDDYSDIDPDTYNEERKGEGKQGTYYEERRGGSQAAIDAYKARKGSYWGGGLQGYTPPKKPLNEFEQKLKEYGLMSTQEIKQSEKGVFENTLKKYGLDLKEEEIQEKDITATEAFGVGLADDLTLGLASWVYGRDDWDDLIKRAERQHKGALMAGRATGFVGSIFIPGGLAVKGAVTAARIGKGATKAAKLAEVAKAGAKVGAVEGTIGGFGYSRGETTLEVARDTGLGTLIGAGAGGSFGVIGAGGLGLWRKVRGKPGIFKEEPGSLELKQSIMGDEKRHIVFSRADSRAREERAFNVETLKSVVKFADLKSKDRKRLLNINGKNVDVKSLVIEWAQTVNPQNFLKRTKDEKLKIEQSTIKFAKKNKLQPELLHAYYNWRSELNNYMRYINDIGGRKERVGKDLKFSVNSLQKELTKFNKNIEAGLVNPTSYNEFKTQEYVAEAVRRFEKAKYAEANIGGKNAKDLDLYEAAAKEASEGLKRDPLSNFLLKKFSTVSNAAEVVDARAGSEMTRITYDLYVAEKLKTGFTRAVADKVKGALKIRESGKYAKMSDERIIKLIESGRKDPLADAYREVFKDIRQFANKKGVKVKEYRFGQEKYVPMKRKGAVDLIESSRDKWKEIQDTFSKEEINNILLKTDNKKFVTKNEELESDLKFLQSLVGDGINEQITSVNLLQKAINKFSDPQNVKSLLSPSIRNVHERHGTLPMWARETDLNSMALIDANSIGDLIYKRPVFNEMDTQIAFLKLRGFNNSANYFNNLKKDLLGIYRKGTEDKAADSIARELKIKTIPGGKLWLGLENAISTAIYPNYLGLNARAFVRNLTQPYTMTTRELGVGIEGDVLAVNATKKIIAEGFGNAQKRFNKLGLLDVRDPTAADFEGLKSGLRHSFKQNKIATKADRFIDGYADTAMYLYSKSDTTNRLVTAQMAEDIAGAVMAGKTKWIKNAPKAIKIELQKNIDEGASKDEITQTIGKWLQVKTQLNYGKDDMYEFGREMGPMFAMLSKWPTAIASDIANKILMEGKKGAYKVGMKYLSPMVFAGGVQYLIDKEIDPKSAQSREMFGYGGLHSILPVNSVTGLTDTFFPIPFDSALQTVGSGIELGAKGLSGRFDDQDSRKAEKVINRTLEQFTPVIGGVKRTIRHWENLTGETDKKRKRKEIKTKY